MAGMVPCEPVGLDFFQNAPNRFTYEVVRGGAAGSP